MRTAIPSALFAIALTLHAAVAAAQSDLPREDLWQPNDTVHALAAHEDTLFIAGAFDWVGPHQLSGSAALDAATGDLLPAFPQVVGAVHAIAPDPEGGWYLGGLFQSVGGQARSNLAHVLPTGEVDPNFAVSAGSAVYALAVDGDRLYAGGAFTSIGGEPRTFLAAVDTTTGAVAEWNPNANGSVHALAVDGTLLYAGGLFTQIGGAARQRVAALDAATALATAWAPAIQGGPVQAISVTQDAIYLGGAFTQAAGQPRIGLAALDPLTGEAAPWDPALDGAVLAIHVAGDTLYLGGTFTHAGAEDLRAGLAAIDRTTGMALPWDPSPESGDEEPAVNALALDGDTLYVAGSFTNIGGKKRRNLAAVDALSGEALPWRADAEHTLHALAHTAGELVAGGNPGKIGGVHRNGLAAIDLITGRPTEWDAAPAIVLPPDYQTVNVEPVHHIVYTLALIDEVLYAGGAFTHIGGAARSGLAALDILTAEALPWNPSVPEVPYGPWWYCAKSQSLPATADTIAKSECFDLPVYVSQIVPVGDTLFAAGMFRKVGTATRNHLAAVSLANGGVESWNPGFFEQHYPPVDYTVDIYARGELRAIAASTSALFAAGRLTTSTALPANRLAAIGIDSGIIESWNPDINGPVHALATHGDTLFAAGDFDTIDTQPRAGIAAFNTMDGTLRAWNPGVTGAISTLVVVDDALIAGGDFEGIGGEPRTLLAALDVATGEPQPWAPKIFDGSVYAVTGTPHGVAVGGSFTTIGASSTRYLTVFPYAESPFYAKSITPSHLATAGDTVSFEVVFNQAANLFNDPGDITLLTSGTSYEGVAITGSGTTYTVTVTGIAGEGTLSLTVRTDSDIQSALNASPLAASVTSPSVRIDHTPPVAAFERWGEAWFPDGWVRVFMTFSEHVYNASDPANFIVTHMGTGHAEFIVTGSGRNYTIDLKGVRGFGTFTITLKVPSTVQDLAGNIFEQEATSEAFAVDLRPRVNAIQAKPPLPSHPEDFEFLVMFSEEVTGVDDASDFIIGHAGTSHDTLQITGAGDTYRLLLKGVRGIGRMTVAVNPESNIQDRDGDPLAPGTVAAHVALPNLPSAVEITPAPFDPYSETATFTVRFSEPVVGFDSADDVVVSRSQHMTLGSVEIAGEGDTYTVTLDGLCGTGHFALAVRVDSDVETLTGDRLFASVLSPTLLITCWNQTQYPIYVDTHSVAHTADTNGDFQLTLSELLRAVQFYNQQGLRCATTATEDGYVPATSGDTTCAPHALDYNPQDWHISLSELLRLIYFYNVHEYYYCTRENSEDGFCSEDE